MDIVLFVSLIMLPLGNVKLLLDAKAQLLESTDSVMFGGVTTPVGTGDTPPFSPLTIVQMIRSSDS